VVLASRFYHEAIRPILDDTVPGLAHSAALIGSGSEVLGFDTPVSTDHHWGPRAMIFVRDADHAARADEIRHALATRLPHDFLGWPTSFAQPDPVDPGTRHLERRTSGPVDSLVEVLTVRGYLLDYLGFAGDREPASLQWLTFPSQKLLAVTAGAVFHDDIGLEETRARLAWYPRDVWLYLLAAGWKRIGQEEHLMGRAGQVGDEIGSAVLAARLVRDVMRLCFLMERRYAPYPKWLGSAFANLAAASRLTPILTAVLHAKTWVDRDRALADAYGVIAEMHDALGLTDSLPRRARRFWGRPFNVIYGDRVAKALLARIADPDVRAIPWAIGGVDQWSDSTDLLEAAAQRERLEGLYRPTE
jgi:hypothetical protein